MPSAHAIQTWVNNFEETGSTVKKKGGSVKTVRTPQNIDAVRASFEQSPRRSAVRHSKKRTVREQCQAYFTLGFALRIQEEISRMGDEYTELITAFSREDGNETSGFESRGNS